MAPFYQQMLQPEPKFPFNPKNFIYETHWTELQDGTNKLIPDANRQIHDQYS
jgi:hypothetical protein